MCRMFCCKVIQCVQYVVIRFQATIPFLIGLNARRRNRTDGAMRLLQRLLKLASGSAVNYKKMCCAQGRIQYFPLGGGNPIGGPTSDTDTFRRKRMQNRKNLVPFGERPLDPPMVHNFFFDVAEWGPLVACAEKF